MKHYTDAVEAPQGEFVKADDVGKVLQDHRDYCSRQDITWGEAGSALQRIIDELEAK